VPDVTATATAISAAAGALATEYNVLVGGNGTLTYNPPSISNVSVGDVIRFQFLAKNHTVTQSSFAAPCTNLTTPQPGLDSGFMFINASDTASNSFPVFPVTINSTAAPLWFYCRQTGHCEQGMVFAINPTANKTYDDFVANAKKQTAASTGSSSSASGGSSASGASSTGSSTSTSTGAGASKTSGAGRAGVSAGLLLAGLAAGLVL